ncbi:IS3 family transposase [bacterium]|nr:IS3 family transposase [bacterium]
MLEILTCQIVPRLADEGTYIASESSFYRVLKANGELKHRGRSKKRENKKLPPTHCANGIHEVFTWDITWLPGPVKGLFFYLYLVLDIYSRKIVGWEVYETESSENASKMIQKTIWREGCVDSPLVLHSDNGSPMKGSTLLELLNKLNVKTSYSRPRVSNDNAYSEAIFRTCKYWPTYPSKGFEDLDQAREWVLKFVRKYNYEHRHSSIKFMTPDERHRGLDKEVLARRKAVYEAAKEHNPNRWSGNTRNWQPVKEVWLNPTSDGSEKFIVEKAA